MVKKNTKKSIENPTGLLRGGAVRGLSSQGLLKVNIFFLLTPLSCTVAKENDWKLIKESIYNVDACCIQTAEITNH